MKRARGVALLAISYALAFALHVLQTVLLQLVSYQTSLYAVIVKVLSVAFVLPDVGIFVALVMLARASVDARPFAIPGAVLVPLGLFSSFVGTHLAEPVLSIGAVVCAAFALASIESTRKTRILGWALVGAVHLWIVAQLVTAASSGEHAVVLAWMRWLVDALRLFSIAALAFVVRAQEPGGADAAPKGPYRDAAEGAPVPPKAVSVEALVRAARGVRAFQTGFLLRAIAAAIWVGLVVLLTVVRGRDFAILLLLGPLSSAVAAAMQIRGLVGVRSFPPTTVAIVVLAIGVALDAVTILGGLAALGGSSYSAYRKIEEIVMLECPVIALDGGIAMVLTATALGRLGRSLDAPLVVTRARWQQGLTCLAGATLLALPAMGLELTRHVTPPPYIAIAAALAFTLVGAAIASVILTLLLTAAAIRALEERAAG